MNATPRTSARRRRSDSVVADSDYSETARQWVHIAFGGAALLLTYLPWHYAVVLAAAAVLFNIHLLRRFAGKWLHRPAEAGQLLPAGLVLYPTSVLLLLLMFPTRPDIVAAAWAILAFGDGAATLVGRRYGTAKWRWNRHKSIAGSTALFLAGGMAGAFLAWWCREPIVPQPYLWFSIAAPFAAALVAAAVETTTIRLDDNLSVPLSAGAVLWGISLVNQDLAIRAAVGTPALLAIALPLNTLFAWAAYVCKGVSLSGAVAGGVIGTVTFVCTGWAGWLLLATAFLCATVTSRIGLKRKMLLGIAEDRGGRRGFGNAVANTGIAAGAALLSVLSYAHASSLVAFAAALTAGASDTVASEIGKAYGRRTWAILPPHPVRPGTPGAISLEGTAAGVIGAAALSVFALSLGLIPSEVVPAVIIGAMAGSLIESLLAATFEPPGILDNDTLNLINTATGAFVAVTTAGLLR